MTHLCPNSAAMSAPQSRIGEYVALNGAVTVIVIGLDGEMSASSRDDGGKLIQAGFAAATSAGIDVFSSLIRMDGGLWAEQAAAVHQIPRAELSDAPAAPTVDEHAASWMRGHGGRGDRRHLVPVGFNVGAFDLPFFLDTLPATMSYVSRRTIDLNAVCFFLDGSHCPARGEALDWRGWKAAGREFAAERLDTLGVAAGPHDAGWDAAEALVCYDWMRSQAEQAQGKAPLSLPTLNA